MRQADRIIVNTISNYGLTIVTMATQLVMIPVVVKHLDKSGFGLATMVLAPFGFFEVMAGSFGRALHRFIPQDLAGHDARRVSRTFTTAMAGYGLMGLVGAVATWFAFDWMLAGAEVSSAVMRDGRLAMWVLVVWLVVGFPLWGYRKGLEAIQRYDLLGLSHGLITLLRTVAVIVVFSLGYGSITFFVASHLVSLMLINLLCRRFLIRAVPGMREAPSLIDKATIILVGTFAAATLLGIFGEVCGSYGFRIFIGKELGMDKLGALAAVWTLQLTIGRLIDELTNAFSPAISALDAKGSSANVAKLMLTGTKSSMLVASSMCVVPLAAAAPFLHLWLGDSFRGYDTLLYVFLLVMLPFCVGMTPTYVLFGLGRVTTTGTVMLVRGLAGLLLALAYVQWVDRNLTGAVLCMLGVQNSGGLVMLYSACRAVGVRFWNALYEVMMKPLVLASVAAAVTWIVIRQVGDDRWWKLTVSVGLGELTLLALVLGVGLGDEERARIFSFFHRAWARVARIG